jgi:uncharacterized protein (TIGR02145 family)
MKTILKLKTHLGITLRMIPALLMLLISTLVFNSCEKEEDLPMSARNPLKTTVTIENEYSVFYQNELFIRETGKPVVVTRQIGNDKLSEYEGCLKLHVQSGYNGEGFVSSATIRIDGKTILSTSDFNNSSQSFLFDLCSLTKTSTMEVIVFGTPGSTLEIWIDGVLANSGTFTDARDGRIYSWVKICDKTWMAENLAYLPTVSPSAEGSDASPHYYVYGYEGSSVSDAKATSEYSTYGVLYNWPAAQTAAPAGWHIPDDNEFLTLLDCLGGGVNAYNNLIIGGTTGFNANFPGIRNHIGGFFGIDYYCDLQTSVENYGIGVCVFDLNIGDRYAYVGSDRKARGFSVRCVKD